MKRYYIALLSRLLPLVVSFGLTGFFLGINWYIPALLAFVAGCWLTYFTISFLRRTVKDAKRLIDAIQFSEFNITFRSFADKGLFPELIHLMEKAVARFNEKLQQTEIEHRFYDTLLKRIDSAILVAGKAGEIEWINKAALDEFGKPRPRRLADLAAISPELPGTLEKIVPGEVKIVKTERDGHSRQLAVTAVLFSSGGKELKLVSFKNIQPILEESESDAWKKLIRVLTHEMMNSLTPIISLAETFSEQESMKENDYELMHRAMQTIHRRSKGLVEFVGNYQQLTRIPVPVMETFPVREMVNDINHLLYADGIRFLCEIQPEDMTLFADRTQMEQVLINLIKNAHEACAREQLPEIKIRISKNEYKRPFVVVSDNGCGILPEVMDKIFVPFFTTKNGGSGIGLSICRQIMISHGGNITVESEPGEGTRVVLGF
jgi:nitrogen fixation/metabolism regulation signal transduction histidine kinase